VCDGPISGCMCVVLTVVVCCVCGPISGCMCVVLTVVVCCVWWSYQWLYVCGPNSRCMLCVWSYQWLYAVCVVDLCDDDDAMRQAVINLLDEIQHKHLSDLHSGTASATRHASSQRRCHICFTL